MTILVTLRAPHYAMPMFVFGIHAVAFQVDGWFVVFSDNSRRLFPHEVA